MAAEVLSGRVKYRGHGLAHTEVVFRARDGLNGPGFGKWELAQRVSEGDMLLLAIIVATSIDTEAGAAESGSSSGPL